MTREVNDIANAARPAPVVPTTSQFMNLSAYMYEAYNTPYSSTTLQANTGFVPLTTARGKAILSVDESTGLYAQAFISTGAGPKQVVVAYEGTNLFGQSDTFTGAQVQDDAMIYNGQNALSYKGAASFARRAVNVAAHQGIRRNEVFVTGHSLGAAEAEYAASKTGLAGTAFAGPGIPQSGRGPVSKLTTYVDAGDPIGNYAQDTVLGPAVVSSTTRHFGTATVLTNTSDLNGPNAAFNNVSAQMTLQNAATNWPTADQKTKFSLLEDVALSNLVSHDYHSLTQYANDLNVTLYVGDSSGTAGSDFLPAGATQPTTAARAFKVNAVAVDCFAAGTRIRTTRGEVAVEDLTLGEMAMTAEGEARPIVWIGRRTVDCHRHADATPVRVAAHAFGKGAPTRDLTLSPGHPVLVDADEDGSGGHLVPVMCLVNGTTIERVTLGTVTYWHVELDRHDVLLAEGLPAESYIDLGNRGFFTADADVVLANPDFVAPGLAGRCRPVAVDGPVVEMARRRLDMAFATRIADACAWPDEAGVAIG